MLRSAPARSALANLPGTVGYVAILALAIVAATGQGFLNVILVVGFLDSPIFAPAIALVLWSMVMWAWLYATRVPERLIAPGPAIIEAGVLTWAAPQYYDWSGFNAMLMARTPAGRWGQADEIAGAAVFLASPAAQFVTGATLYVDGGYSAF